MRRKPRAGQGGTPDNKHSGRRLLCAGKQQPAEMVGGAEEVIRAHITGTANASYFHVMLKSQEKKKNTEGCTFHSVSGCLCESFGSEATLT